MIFEKINGYKDGSFFTPGFITMYMCRETIRKAVVQKFNQTKNWECKDLEEIYDKIEDRLEANDIINSLKICDPAVGSGHFLVSALNEMVAVKNDLKILQDRDGKRLKEYQVEVVNDELIVTDEEGELFDYNPNSKESQRIQEALFHEKQILIENCLFGVDINPNSVKICRLRLWIELLKSAYYKNATELETLPNIDINIKCGNSLVSRFDIDTDIKKALKQSKWSINSYKVAVDSYRNAQSKEQKRDMGQLIADIKSDFRSEITSGDPKVKRLRKLSGELSYIVSQGQLFEMSKKEKTAQDKIVKKLTADTKKLEAEIEEIQANKIFENAFEWRFEFPEVLDDDGNYVGFDVVIGNPPYIYRNFDFTNLKSYFKKHYLSNEGNFDLYKFFIERIITLSKQNGSSSFIVPNTFLSAKSYSKLRNVMINNFWIEELYDLGLNVFEGVTVENIIFRVEKNSNKDRKTKIKIQRNIHVDLITPDEEYSIDLSQILNNENSFNIYLREDICKFISKVRENTITLNDIAYCTVGINTGYIKSEMTADRKIDDTYHKMLNGKDIGVYSIKWNDEWIKYDKGFVNSFGKLGRALPPEYIFIDEKILVQRTRRGLRRKLVCCYDDEQYYNLNRISNIVISDDDYSTKYIIGLLNSSLLDYYFNKVFNEYEVKPLHLGQLPIKKTSPREQGPIIEAVEKILEIKANNPDADTSSIEGRIDQLVYQLYGLTEEEIEIIENT